MQERGETMWFGREDITGFGSSELLAQECCIAKPC